MGMGAATAAALLLVPGPMRQTEHDTTLDLQRFLRTECEYKGIVATFGEVTRAYALKVYDRPRLLRWEAQPNPHSPETETLITGVFSADSLKEYAHAVQSDIAAARKEALPVFGVTWRLKTLGALRVSDYDLYARDALDVFRHTVEDLLDQIVLVTHASTIRVGAGAGFTKIKEVEAGTMLFEKRRQGQWSYVRIPESKTVGWVERHNLRAVGHER